MKSEICQDGGEVLTPLVRITTFPPTRAHHQQNRFKAQAGKPFRTPLYPSFPKCCLAAFYESRWWDGLNKIERPTSYNVNRNRIRNAAVDLKSFKPEFGARVMGFRTGYCHSGPLSLQEYWVGLKPDGSYYTLGLSCFNREKAYASYIQKLCYWGRRPTISEDKRNLATVIKNEGQDIFDVRLPVSLETTSAGSHKQERISLGVVLGATDVAWKSSRYAPTSKPRLGPPVPTFDEALAEGLLDEAAFLVRRNWGVPNKRVWKDASQGVQRDPRLREKRGGVNRRHH